MAELTPMMQQYMEIKKQHMDAILFYRLGDFYEMFFEDAKTASKELELVLTGRDCGLEQRAPMCGIPFHAADTYIARLVAKGYKVAVCEQQEDPALAKGIVTRGVIRIVTPGTLTSDLMLDESKNNYLAVIYVNSEGAGLGFCDVSTGETYFSEISDKDCGEKVVNEIARFKPSELMLNKYASDIREIKNYITRKINIMADVKADSAFEETDATSVIEKHFGKTLEQLQIDGRRNGCIALANMLSYLYDTQKNSLANVTELHIYTEEKYLSLNEVTRRNLELTETERRREKRGSLLWVLDKTKTAMGKRLLRSWIEQPLVNVSSIVYRQNAVEEMFAGNMMRSEIAEKLSCVNDLERIMTRVVYGTANAKELRSLAQTSAVLPALKGDISSTHSNMLTDINSGIDTLEDICELINKSIVDEPPFSVREGGMIREGYNSEVDELRSIESGGKDFIAEIERREQEKTGIKKLKIGYNRVFGYYIEVLNSFKDLVPETYIRKQTLANAERYITPELKELEGRILGAKERLVALEYELFCKVRDTVADAQDRIRLTASSLANLDVICSLATVASTNHYVRPLVDMSDVIDIKNGRHPVVEKFLDDAPFVPNDTLLDGADNRTAIITGPNMAGKSTYMRQVAVIVLMAQMGSFVPASDAKIGVVDKIFTRVGASDDLVGGASTFMTEMNEVSQILSSATGKSLIILDEIGRGTSTFDGMSIARAVLEFVTDKKKIGAKTLFATHYHELTELEGTADGMKNYNTSVKKRGDDITFLRKIVRGPADGSYGIEVAKLSGIPQSVVSRAKVILKELEDQGTVTSIPKSQQIKDRQDSDLMSGGLFSDVNNSLIEEIKQLSLDTLTPIEAMTKLYEIKSKII